jgi:hypothetical protein
MAFSEYINFNELSRPISTNEAQVCEYDNFMGLNFSNSNSNKEKSEETES